MAERKAVTRQMVARYRQVARGVEPSPPRRRVPTYGQDELVPLRRIWAVLNAPSGKRLAPFMAEAVEAMERPGELRVDRAVRAKLLRVSAATIDRMLAPERWRRQVKGRSGTKPGSPREDEWTPAWLAQSPIVLVRAYEL